MTTSASLRPPDVLLDRHLRPAASIRRCRTSPPTSTGSRARASRSSATTSPSSRPRSPAVRRREGRAAQPRQVACLPLVRVDGRIVSQGSYPSASSWPPGAASRTRHRAGRRRQAVAAAADRLLLKGRCVMEFLETPDAQPVLHRQGRRRQDLARLRHGRRAWPTGASGCCSSAPTRPSNLDEVLGAALGQQADADSRRARTSGRMNIDPEAAARDYRERMVGPYRGVLPDAAVASMEEQFSGSCTLEIAAFDEFSRLLGDAAGDRGVRPRHLRHRPDRAHAAAAVAARPPGTGSCRDEHDRHVVPGAAGRACRRSRSSTRTPCAPWATRRVDHAGAGHPARGGGPARGGPHQRRTGRPRRRATSTWSSTASSRRPTRTTRWPRRWSGAAGSRPGSDARAAGAACRGRPCRWRRAACSGPRRCGRSAAGTARARRARRGTACADRCRRWAS